MLDLVKKSLKITSNAYDDELNLYINAALKDLGIAGITRNTLDEADEAVKVAVLTYCRLHHGSPEDRDFLKASYDEQKGMLQSATGYTDWGDVDVSE